MFVEVIACQICVVYETQCTLLFDNQCATSEAHLLQVHTLACFSTMTSELINETIVSNLRLLQENVRVSVNSSPVKRCFSSLSHCCRILYFKPPEGRDRIDVQEVWGLSNAPSDYEVRIIARNA